MDKFFYGFQFNKSVVRSMPKYSREMEEKIIALFEQGKRNSVISRELSIDRGGLPRRRKEWEKRKQKQEKPETEPEKTFEQEQNDSHPLDPQIYMLIRHQGTNTREEAIQQAIETQQSLNPYILNHGLETPAELVKFFEEEIQLERTLVKGLMLDLKTDSDISQRLIATYQETIAELKELVGKRFEDGIEQGRENHGIYVKCVICDRPYQVVPLDKAHSFITQVLHEEGWGHTSCVERAPR